MPLEPTPITAWAAALPPAPVQVSTYSVVTSGDTVCDPLIASVPVQPPLDVQEPASLAYQDSTEDPPAAMSFWLAVKLTVGGGAPVATAITACACAVPPAPMQVST